MAAPRPSPRRARLPRIRWRAYTPDVAAALARWLHSWPGLGAVVVGMHAQGFDAELKQFPYAWRVNFYPVAIAHSIVYGAAAEQTACARSAADAAEDPR